MNEPKYNKAEKKHIADSFGLVVRGMAELELDILTIRAFMRSEGVTDEEFGSVRAEIKRRHDERSKPAMEELKKRIDDDKLLKLLAKGGVTKQ